MTQSDSFGAPGHRGVPLIFAWGIHTGLSYQRPGWKQASLEELKREGIDRFVKWGANLVDLFPSNKEAYFDEYHVAENSAVPTHCFREHPDDDQENKWRLADFLEFNRHAHENGFLVTWMIHNWWPAPYEFRARVLWTMCRELGETTSDILADGFKHHIDGYAAEGDFIVPEEANNLLWPYHPGMYTRESAWGLNYTVGNFIQPRGFHLTDGRILMYEREEYMGLAPECWRGFEAVWRGEEIRVKHGKLFIGLQAEGRDKKCQDDGWAIFGGMSSVDIFLEQINNYARAKGRGWTTASTTAIRVINEPLLSPAMKRYMAGICSDPVRCAVAASIEQTGTDGRYPRVDYPKGTWFLQNNHFRAYFHHDRARVDLHYDREGQGNFSNFVWNTSEPVLQNLIESRFAENQELRFNELRPAEEAGGRACVYHRAEFGAGKTTMAEFRDFQAEADNPWLAIRIRRIFVGGEASRSAATFLNLEGYQPSGPSGRLTRFSHAGQKPDLAVYIPDNDQIENIRWDSGRLEIHFKAANSHDISLYMMIGVPKELRDDELKHLAEFQAEPQVFSLAEEISINGPESCETVRTVQITNPSSGPYWVCENDWWQARGAQPSWNQRGTDFIKVVLTPHKPARIRPFGFLDGVVKNAWGCQYTQLLRDVKPTGNGVAVTVRVADISPKIWAPRIEFHRPIASASVDGREWYYFEGSLLFLPNHRHDYHVEVEFGRPEIPHAVCTFASIEKTRWEGNSLKIETTLPEWMEDLAPGERYYLAVANAGWNLDKVKGGEVCRTIPDFESIKPAPMAGPDGIATLVPRDYNHPPLRGFSKAKGQVIAFIPGRELQLAFSKE